MKNRAAVSLGLLASLALVASSAVAPGCGGGGAKAQPDGGATGGAGGGDAGVVYISPDKCKPVGAANEVGPTDPAAQGQCIFLLDTWGTEVLGEWPPADFMLGLIKDEPAVFGQHFETFGFIPDPNDDLPIGFKRGIKDPTQVHETCALCHAAKLPDGRLWFGAPNLHLDFARFSVEVNKRWVAKGNPPLLTPLAITKSGGCGPGRTDAESGDYPFLVAADFPPYFTLSKRTHMNYLGTGSDVRTEAYFSLYTFGAGSPNDQMAKVPFPPDDRVDAFLLFFGNMASPKGPAQDAAQVTQGKAVYDAAKCGSCHHVDDIGLDQVVTYDKDPAGKERLPGDDPAFPAGSIRTDIMHRVLADGSVGPDAGVSDAGMDTGYADLIMFIIEHHLSVSQSDGYRTSDLHGLWATAPYLHNGSVPTLDDLLKPAAQRPATWMRDGFLVDTTVLGNGNIGHEFGTTLSDSDRKALVAYLSSL